MLPFIIVRYGRSVTIWVLDLDAKYPLLYVEKKNWFKHLLTPLPFKYAVILRTFSREFDINYWSTIEKFHKVKKK